MDTHTGYCFGRRSTSGSARSTTSSVARPLRSLQVERFYQGRPEGPIKTFALRGIEDSPPYLHDGRCPTLHDAVEFFDLVLELKLTRAEKDDLVAFLLCL